MGKREFKVEKGENGKVKILKEIRIINDAISTIQRRRSPFFLLSKSIVESSQFTFSQSDNISSQLNLFSSIYIKLDEISIPTQKYNFDSEKENVFSSSCNNDEVFV